MLYNCSSYYKIKYNKKILEIAMTDYKLFEEYDRLPGVPPKLLSRVKKLCGSTYADLLFHIPHSVIDRRAFTTIENAESGKLQTLKVIVTSVKTPANARSPFKVYVTDESAEIMELLFFNVGNWIKKSFPEGKQMYLSGMVEEDFASKKIATSRNLPSYSKCR